MSVVLAASYDPAVDIAYVNAAMDAADDYPTYVGPTLLPEIWAPRLYAKGLNTLELASSGRVAVTTNDKHALDIVVEEHPDIEHDHTYLNFANDGFTLASKLQDVLTALPSTVTPGVNDTVLAGNNTDIVSTETLTLTASEIVADASDSVSITAPAVDITATNGDIILGSGANLTLTIKEDRLVVLGDIDITGVVNSASTVTVETSNVTDNYINISNGLANEITTGSLGSQAGLRIQTAPNGAASTFGDPVDTYLRRFKTEDGGGLAFYTNNVFDAAKYAATSSIFHKGILFNVGKGYAAGGYKTPASRAQEPYWNALGGALRISRVVPGPDDDTATRVGIAFRITNSGELEIVQHRTTMNLVNGVYVDAAADAPKVLALMGHVPSV
jgi:hypothetical protein